MITTKLHERLAVHKEKGSEIGELLLTVLFYLHVESELTVITSVLETMQTHTHTHTKVNDHCSL